MPNFSFLYENPEFEITNNNNGGIIGNAALKPEKTVMYEIGFKQEIAYKTAIDLTIFYRDTRDWVGVSPTIKNILLGTTGNMKIKIMQIPEDSLLSLIDNSLMV